MRVELDSLPTGMDAVVAPDQEVRGPNPGDSSRTRSPGRQPLARAIARMLGMLVLLSTAAVPALAGGLCIQVDAGASAGSLIVLKKVKLGASVAGPAEGFIALYSGGQYAFFFPVDGQALNNAAHDLAVGLTYHRVGFSAGGALGGGGPSSEIGVRCIAGPDQKINVLDACGFYFDNSAATGHVVDCAAAPSLP